jgi:hypothetical protein
MTDDTAPVNPYGTPMRSPAAMASENSGCENKSLVFYVHLVNSCYFLLFITQVKE